MKFYKKPNLTNKFTSTTTIILVVILSICVPLPSETRRSWGLRSRDGKRDGFLFVLIYIFVHFKIQIELLIKDLQWWSLPLIFFLHSVALSYFFIHIHFSPFQFLQFSLRVFFFTPPHAIRSIFCFSGPHQVSFIFIYKVRIHTSASLFLLNLRHHHHHLHLLFLSFRISRESYFAYLSAKKNVESCLERK